MSRLEQEELAMDILAMPIPEQLRLAAHLLDESAKQANPAKKLNATKIAHSIIDRISTEFGAALALHALRSAPGSSSGGGDTGPRGA